jgi:Putative peptidoglycan binding domain
MGLTWKTVPTRWPQVIRVVLSLAVLCVSACTTPGHSNATPSALGRDSVRPAVDRFMTRGEIRVAEGHLRDLGFEPGPVDGTFTAETQAAIRAFQSRYGMSVSGLLDRETRLELLPGVDEDELDP